jgi:hypothetical protein
MAISNKVPDFLPSASGLQFSNWFPPNSEYPVITLPVVGTIKQDANTGLCDGFAYTTLDLFLANPRIKPIDIDTPASGTPRFNYLAKREIDSFGSAPAFENAKKLIEWIQTPSHDVTISFYGNGLAHRMVKEEWPRIKADIDSGTPSPLLLVMEPKCGPGDIPGIIAALKRCHGVLAYAYSLDDKNNLTLSIYNCNEPGVDSSTIILDISNPEHTIDITATGVSKSIPFKIRGFFRPNYTFKNPESTWSIHDGTLLVAESGTIYVVYGGAKFGIPSLDIFNEMKFNWADERKVSDRTLTGISNMPVDGTLLREENGAVWVIYNGAKFHVPDPATLSRLFANMPIYQLWNGALDNISTIPGDGMLIREENGAIWVIYDGTKFHVPDPATLSRLFANKPIYQLWNGVLDYISTPMHYNGMLLREENGAIWVIYGGAKFHVPDPATLSRLFANMPIYQLWNGALDNISTIPGDGTLIHEDNGAVWVIYGEAKFHVPDPATLSRLFANMPIYNLWNGVLDNTSTIPIDGTYLCEESSSIESSPIVYCIENGMKIQVPNSTSNRVYLLWFGALAQIPLAPPGYVKPIHPRPPIGLTDTIQNK